MRAIVVTAAVLAGVGLSGCGMTKMSTREQLVATPATCVAQRFDVYFADSEAGLTPAARQAIGATAELLKGCKINRVQVLGLADARGGQAANLNLSERRAQAVAAALTEAGWPAPVFDVSAAGDSGATTDAGVREPLRRRTEVLVEAVNPT
ncbi:OmpA family protein [Brevundimonas sp. Leaf363]|uniref:OmpA family protein n=1 Tax=Brevundimonas sp. Leaf363 TaxID=1736353 RepID=UPI000A9E0AAE|nr:OmpA family protein [Brevundimonas sp. Leaf363]